MTPTFTKLLEAGVFVPRDPMVEIELLPDEQALLLEYGYPFEPEKQQLLQLVAKGGIGVLRIKPFYLTQLIGDLSYSVNKRTKGRIQDEVNELCERLEYIQATGDGELDLM